MSKVRVVFAEVDGSDEMIRSVISQMTEKVGARVVMEAAPIADAPRLLRAAPTKMPRNTGRVKTAVAALGGGALHHLARRAPFAARWAWPCCRRSGTETSPQSKLSSQSPRPA